jgi:ribosomal protein L20
VKHTIGCCNHHLSDPAKQKSYLKEMHHSSGETKMKKGKANSKHLWYRSINAASSIAGLCGSRVM